MRHWMKVPSLEFKQRQPQQRSQWDFKQWWNKAWGIDYETQVDIVNEKHAEYDNVVDGIKVHYILKCT